MSALVANLPAKASEQTRPKTAQPRGDLCFMESQFPVSKMSKESYAERTAKQSQTLTGLGKWWGRKPLVLCRATILGLLLPATDNPQRDREVFLRLMTMDDDGMLRRKSANIPAKELFKRLSPALRTKYFEPGSKEDDARLMRGLSKEEKQEVQRRVFLSLSYDERLEYCDRPEQVDGPSPESWGVINAHLGTNAASLTELVAELGKRRFGHVPRVGDSFCGGGSIPFEAARLGCDAYGSDLNPVAALLTWASLNIVGGGEKVAAEVRKAQREVYEAVDHQITEWGIEHREPDPKTERCWRADAFLHCAEVECPECGWRIPLAGTWVIGKGSNTIVRLIPNEHAKQFDFEVATHVTANEVAAANAAGTVKDSELVCAHCTARTPIRAIRGDGRGTFGDNKSLLRPWENNDVAPCDSDIFGERLYCIRWEDTWTAPDRNGKLKVFTERYYCAPTLEDLRRERDVMKLLMERFADWQKRGFLPNRKIEPGAETSRLAREKGWTYWHQLFTPRELLVAGLFNELAASRRSAVEIVGCGLALGRSLNYLSRLSMWHAGAGNEKVDRVFVNQALNTYYSYAGRAWPALRDNFIFDIQGVALNYRGQVAPKDGRAVEALCDLWVTDPPYADAVCYEEISEFFLVWYQPCLSLAFPKWAIDSKRALAVKGNDENFVKSMVDCYRRLRENMPDDGLQVVMFTHQDASVWADLALILWAAGLRVTAAWCIATETESSLKEGNYVQGTVLLVLRKQTSEDTAFLDEVYQEVEAEVRRQLDTMRDLDDAKDPNFTDTDYPLAAYAAALRVLTSKAIPEINVAYELTRTRKKDEKSEVEKVIDRAVEIAWDHLVPRGVDRQLWKTLEPAERFFIKGLEMESHGERRLGPFQDMAKGLRFGEYQRLLASTKPNETRLKTATEFGSREMSGSAASPGGFGASLVRHALFAACKTRETESPRDGITWLTTEVKDYAASRQRVIEILEFLAALRQNASLPHWHKDAEAAGLLAGALRNRQDNV